MRRLGSITFIGLVIIGLVGCSESEGPSRPLRPESDSIPQPSAIDDPCGEVTTIRLLAGQTIEVGTVTVENDGEELCVTYTTTADWWIAETHLDIRLTPEDIPQTRSGNPKVGKFAYQHDLDPPMQFDEYCLSLSELGYTAGTDLHIAAHAAVERLVDDVPVQEETAWGEGPDFPGSNWAMYLGHTVQECNDEGSIEEGEFVTYTQSEWGSDCVSPGSAGCYRDDDFASCFTDGESSEIVVGCKLDGFYVVFTGPEFIDTFLPTFGPPGQLVTNYYNPTLLPGEEGPEPEAQEAGELLGQIVALTLSVGFDLCDPNFGSSDLNLRDLVVCAPDSPFAGWTVQEVLGEANRILGGCTSGWTAEEINEALTAINSTFVPGIPIGSYLCLPGGGNDE